MRSGISWFPRDCRHGGPTSAAMPRRSVPCRPECLAGQNCAALRRAVLGLWNATKAPCPRAAPCRAAAMSPPIGAPATRAMTATIQDCPADFPSTERQTGFLHAARGSFWGRTIEICAHRRDESSFEIWRSRGRAKMASAPPAPHRVLTKGFFLVSAIGGIITPWGPGAN